MASRFAERLTWCADTVPVSLWSDRIGLTGHLVRPKLYLKLVVANQKTGRASLFVKRDMLNRYGLGDASSLLERVVVVSEADESSWINLILADRRVDYSQGSVISGWLHPSYQLAGDDFCPCGAVGHIRGLPWSES
jgi:hypothetical protein